MMNTPFGDIQQEAWQELFGKALFHTSTSKENPFSNINQVINWAIERGLDITFQPIDTKVRCLISSKDSYTKATASTWYEALYRCCIAVSRESK